MNCLDGKIVSISYNDHFIFVGAQVEEAVLSAVVLKDETLSWLELGARVRLLFKELEVMIATKTSHVSARNSFVSPIKAIERGGIFANVTFDFFGHEINSVITVQALDALTCKEQELFMWFVKTNEVTLQKVEKHG